MKKSINTFLQHPTKDNTNRSANPPVARASTILFDTMQELYKHELKIKRHKKVTHYSYGRYGSTTTIELENIIKEASLKWNLIDTLIINRYGKLQVNDKIVLVASFSSHRKESFEACNYIMDYLKKDAPFWKKEFYDKENEWLINTN